jgi:drug/metabolite transporter (DMT)-like permease
MALVQDILPFMGVMLATGAANTILMKYMVMAYDFEHPWFQTVLMMIGELMCLGVFYYNRRGSTEPLKPVPSWVFLVPCVCDFTATTLVNGAYIFLAASVIQMTRGAIVIFTCLFSMVFLGQRQEKYHFIGVGLVFLGLTTVSFSALINGDAVSIESKFNALLGLFFCVSAQIFQASMLVYEEKVMKNADYEVEPLQMVGMEGLWGCIIGVVLLAGFNVTGIESTSLAMGQMASSVPLVMTVIGSCFSIAFFNWSGITVTQRASATARSTIDSSRTILIWVIELALHWNSFNILQLLGFVFLASGTMIYNQIIEVPGLDAIEAKKEKEPLTA